jgi:hypothetical protein
MHRRVRTIALAALLGFAAFRGIAEDDPLVFSATAWDFGTVDPAASPETTLSVANRSTSTVIMTLISTCDCLVVDPSRRVMAPGATAAFRIAFDPSDEQGEVSRTLVVATDISGRPRSLFTVTGRVTGADGEGAGASLSPAATASSASAGASKRVAITYWYTPGCRSCERFLAEEVPRLARERDIAIDVTRRDLLAPGGYEEFALAVAAHGATVHGIPGLLVGDGALLQGEEEIRDGLAGALDAAVAGTAPASAVPAPPAAVGRGALALLPVLAGGLLDGINPCAFTTLIFLLASLALAGRGRREVLLLGGAFTLTVFVTYFAVGLGLLAALRAAVGFPVVSRILRWLLVAVLAVFAVLSARDAALAARGRASEMTLQLPGSLKRRIHASIRTGVRSAALAASALGLGFLVSVFEFACTGQVYLPTLAYLARLGDARAVPLLVAYNLGFIAPLVAVFAASWIGVTSRGLGVFFQRHLVAVKVALALFFAALAALTLAT